MKNQRRWGEVIRVAAATTAACAALSMTAPIAQAQSGAMASIAGPVAVTAQSGEPYRGANEQPVAGPGLPIPALAPFGYVEEEYFVSGAVDGKPYKTSLLVRKPKDPAKFSGLAVVETIHAQGAIPMWGFREVWMPNGHAWVAIGSQLSALETHVKKSNPTRYSDLQIPKAEAAAGPSASNPMAGGAQDLISQAILTQVGALLKSNAKNGPLSGMNVRYLIMGGSSQTGGTTLRYIESSHAKARMPNGKPIYDGYLPMEAFSSTPIQGGDAAVMHPVGEGDLMVFSGSGRPMAQRADGDAPNDRYRHYQFAGAAHVVTRGITNPEVVFPTLKGVLKPGEQLSQFPCAELYRAAAIHLIAWVTKGVAPPKGARIEIANGAIARDEFGNAKGGIRSPYVDVPTVRYIASAPATDSSNMFRRLIGLEEPIPKEKLRALYKSKEEYLSRFNKGIDRMVAERWLMPADGDKLKKEEAEHAPL